MEARIVCQFGMKRCGEEPPLSRSDDPPVGKRSENFHALANRFDDRRANEDRMIIFLRARRLFEFGNIQIYFKRIDLTSKRIASHFDIHQTEQRLIATHVFR